MNAKKKGNAGENRFAAWLRNNGVKAFKDGASGGSVHKGDVINGLDMCFEVKICKRIFAPLTSENQIS